ncbi:MAG TPA: hypothetical protein VGR96_11690, partial [Acidobacteriaceae bacterium]|nr:hypothetical protein [Acidobacteriaceae bacterium]
AMGAMSGGINSLTSATVIDIYQRILRPGAQSRQVIRAARITTVFWGITATGIALFAGRLGELANLFNKASSFLGGVILGVFLVGMLNSRSAGRDTLLGAAGGIASVVALATLTHVSWLFYGPVGCGVTYIGAWVSSRARPGANVVDPELLMRWKHPVSGNILSGRIK